MKNSKLSFLTILTAVLLIGTSSCNPAVANTAATSEPTKITLPTPSPAPTIQPADLTRQLEINGSKRTYYLYIPPGIDADHTTPVVFFFHGLYSVELTRSTTHFDEIADANGFITVYPVGIGGSWNAGDCCGIAVENQVDEIVFIRQILSDLGTIAKIDPKRIYATGFYNGAMLSYRLACEMSDTFAAVAPVAGTLVFSPCEPQQPVSILHIHGLSDPYVPFAGGTSLEGSLPQLPPVEHGIASWVQFDDCTSSPQVNVDDAITHMIYICKAGTGIELYTLDGLEGWPQSAGAGKLSFLTNQAIWDFFVAHPKPE